MKVFNGNCDIDVNEFKTNMFKVQHNNEKFIVGWVDEILEKLKEIDSPNMNSSLELVRMNAETTINVFHKEYDRVDSLNETLTKSINSDMSVNRSLFNHFNELGLFA